MTSHVTSQSFRKFHHSILWVSIAIIGCILTAEALKSALVCVNSGAWLVTSTNDMSHFTRCHCHGGGSLTGAIRWESRTCTPTSWPSSLTRRENGSLARGRLWKSMADEVSFIVGYEACSQFDCTFKNYIKLGYVLCRCRCHSLDST